MTTVTAKTCSQQQHPISPGLYASMRPSELNQLTMRDITKTIRCMYVKNMVSQQNSDDIMGAVFSCFSLELQRVLSCSNGNRAALAAYEKDKMKRITMSHVDYEESIVVYGYTLNWGWFTEKPPYYDADRWMEGWPIPRGNNGESLVEALVWLLCAQYWNDLVQEMSANTYESLTTRISNMEGTYVTRLAKKKYILTDTHKVGWSLEDQSSNIKPLANYPKHFAANCKGYACWKTGESLATTLSPEDSCHVAVPRYHSKTILVDKTTAISGSKTPPYLTIQTIRALTALDVPGGPLGFIDVPPKLIRRYNSNNRQHILYNSNLAQFLCYAKANVRIHYGRFLTAKVHHLAVVCGCPLLFEKHFDEGTRDLSFLSNYEASTIIAAQKKCNQHPVADIVHHLSEAALRDMKTIEPKYSHPGVERFLDSDLVSFTGLAGQYNAYHEGEMDVSYSVCTDAHVLETTTVDFRHMFTRYAKRLFNRQNSLQFPQYQCTSGVYIMYPANSTTTPPLYQHCVVRNRSDPSDMSTSVMDKEGQPYPKPKVIRDRTGRYNDRWKHFVLQAICPLATTLQLLGSTCNDHYPTVDYASLNGIKLITKGETIRRIVKKVAVRAAASTEVIQPPQPQNDLSNLSQLTKDCIHAFTLWWCTTLKSSWRELCDASFSDSVCNQKATNRDDNTATLTLLAHRMGLTINSDVVECSLFDPVFEYCGTAKSDKIHQRPTVKRRSSHLTPHLPVIFQLELTSILKQRPNEDDIEDIVYPNEDSDDSEIVDDEGKDPMSFNRNDLKRNMRPINIDCLSSHVTETARQARSFLEHRDIVPIQDDIAKRPIKSLHYLYWDVMDEESMITSQIYVNRALNLDHYQQVFKTLHGSRLRRSAFDLGVFYIPDDYSDAAFSDLCTTSRMGKESWGNPGIMDVFKNNGGKATPDYMRLCHNNHARAVTFNINQVAGLLTFYYNSLFGSKSASLHSSSSPLHCSDESKDSQQQLEEIECIKRGRVSEKLGKLVLDISAPFVAGKEEKDEDDDGYSIVAIPLFEKKRWLAHTIMSIALKGPDSGFYISTASAAQPPVAVSTMFDGVWPHLKGEEISVIYPLKCKCPLCESLYSDLISTHGHWYSIKNSHTQEVSSCHLYGVMQHELNLLNIRCSQEGDEGQAKAAENEWLYGNTKSTNTQQRGQKLGQTAEDAVTQSFLHQSLHAYYAPLHTTPSYYDKYPMGGSAPCQTLKSFIQWVKQEATETKKSCVQVVNENNHSVCALHLLSLAEVAIQFMIHSQIASGSLRYTALVSTTATSFQYYTLTYQSEERVKGDKYTCNLITLTEELRLPVLVSQPRTLDSYQHHKTLAALFAKALSKNTVMGAFFDQYAQLDDGDSDDNGNDVRALFLAKLLSWMATWCKFEVQSEKKRVRRNECKYMYNPIHWVKHSAQVPTSSIIPKDVSSTDWKQCRITNTKHPAEIIALADKHPSGSLTLGSLIFRTYMVLESEIQALWTACSPTTPVYQQARITSLMLSCICALFLSDEWNSAKGTISSGLEYEYNVSRRHCAGARPISCKTVPSTASSLYKPAEMEPSVNHLYESISKDTVNWLTNGNNTQQYQKTGNNKRTANTTDTDRPSNKRQKVDGLIQAYFIPINTGSTSTIPTYEGDLDEDAFIRSTETQLSLCSLTALMTHLNFHNIRQYLTKTCSTGAAGCSIQWIEANMKMNWVKDEDQKLYPFMLETLVEQPELVPADSNSKSYKYELTVDEIVSTKLSAIAQQFLY